MNFSKTTALTTSKISPAVKILIQKGLLRPEMKILDFGAGHGRHVLGLKNEGFQNVLGVDKFNQGKHVQDLEAAKGKSFDVVFSSFVLNVVPDSDHDFTDIDTEDDIIDFLKPVCSRQIHIVRNLDILEPLQRIQKVLKEKKVSNHTTNYIQKNFDKEISERFMQGKASSDDLFFIASRGYITKVTKEGINFQRIPFLEEKGFDNYMTTPKFKIYIGDHF